MGEVGDPKAVIDSKARVIGVKGVRVVDASAFPFLPPGHPSAAICKSSISFTWSPTTFEILRNYNSQGHTIADGSFARYASGEDRKRYFDRFMRSW